MQDVKPLAFVGHFRIFVFGEFGKSRPYAGETCENCVYFLIWVLGLLHVVLYGFASLLHFVVPRGNRAPSNNGGRGGSFFRVLVL